MRALITQERFDSQIAQQELSILMHNMGRSHQGLLVQNDIFKLMLFTFERITWLFRAKNVSPRLVWTRDPFTTKLKYLLRNCDLYSASFFAYTPLEALLRQVAVHTYIRDTVDSAILARNRICHMAFQPRDIAFCKDALLKLMHLLGQEIHCMMAIPLNAGRLPNLQIVLTP